MAAVTLALPGDSANTTDFRTWGLAVSNQLTTFGLPKTTDAGQINWATTGSPGTGNASVGYEIRTFSDPLTAVAPFYFKFEYGSGVDGAAGHSPGMWITIGKTTDGNGNVNGGTNTSVTSSSRFEFACDFSTTTNQNCFMAGGPNYLAMSLFDGSLPQQMFLTLERTKDTSGNDTSYGCMIFVTSLIGTACQTLPSSGIGMGATGAWVAAINTMNLDFIPGMQNNGTVGVTAPVVFNFYPMNIGYNQYLYQASDFGPYSQVSITTYGNTHNYIALGQWSSPIWACNDLGISNNNRVLPKTFILMRYD